MYVIVCIYILYIYRFLIQTRAGSRFLNKPEHNKLNLGSSFPITKQRLKSWGCWRFSFIWLPYQVLTKLWCLSQGCIYSKSKSFTHNKSYSASAQSLEKHTSEWLHHFMTIFVQVSKKHVMWSLAWGIFTHNHIHWMCCSHKMSLHWGGTLLRLHHPFTHHGP